MFKKIIIIVSISLFLFFRFYRITDSFLFFNDMGRDLLVLEQWHQTGKPPLLGPQTSASPFNQSAIYFYYLYIFYLLSHFSPYCALFANAFLYLSFYLCGLWYFRRQPRFQNLIIVAFFLLSIHPQYIIQSRFVWNPSLTTPFILAALLFALKLKTRFDFKEGLIFGLFSATSLSLSYSLIPTVFVIFLFLSFSYFSRFKQYLFIIAAFIVSLILVNFPTIIFELRHHFLLTQSVLRQPLQPQSQLGLLDKFRSFSQYLFATTPPWLNYFLAGLIIILAIFYRNFFGLLFLGTTLLLFFLPISLQAHYIFGLTSTLFLFIASLPSKLKTIVFISALIIYLVPNLRTNYFATSQRSLADMQRCFATICQDQTAPIFVSVQSNLHPYHNGPEHRYLLTRAGCQVKPIEDDQKSANLMAVVDDGGNFDPQKTTYYELSLFGPNKVLKVYTCLPQFKVFLLQKQ